MLNPSTAIVPRATVEDIVRKRNEALNLYAGALTDCSCARCQIAIHLAYRDREYPQMPRSKFQPGFIFTTDMHGSKTYRVLYCGDRGKDSSGGNCIVESTKGKVARIEEIYYDAGAPVIADACNSIGRYGIFQYIGR